MPAWDPNEKYWSDEEASLRKRGIDPMQVEQRVPPKLPTHPGNTTLHALPDRKVRSYRNGGKVVSCKSGHVDYSYAAGGKVPSLGSAVSPPSPRINKSGGKHQATTIKPKE